MDLFSSSDEGRETPTLLGTLESANLSHWTTVSLFSSPQHGNRCSLRNTAISNYLEFGTMWKIHKFSDSERE
jgi:hypothetical protein